jgi:membrane protein YdbS with pleckstrin-like domain
MWVVVNSVNVVQAVGFASRSRYGMAVNHALGLLIAVLAIPATFALVAFVRAGSPWWIGLAVFDAFVVLMLVVYYLRPVEWRHRALRTMVPKSTP